MPFLLAKSYIKEHTRIMKDGRRILVPAHYDKRVKKGTEHAPGHHHDLRHLDEDARNTFDRMHAEQHLLHHFHGHALRKKISEDQAHVDKLDKEAATHEAAGRHKEAARARNKSWMANSRKTRREKELADIQSRVDGISAMKESLVQGAGSVGESSDESHAAYAGKLGARFKSKPKPKRKAKTVDRSAKNDKQSLNLTGNNDEDDPSSENYRYRDTGYIAGSRKEAAALFLILAGREKRQVSARDIDWDAIEENPRQAEKLIVKSNLFGQGYRIKLF
jgi:hypothetical protein